MRHLGHEVLLDTKVVLDWLLDRKPWSDDAKPLWHARDADQITAYLPATEPPMIVRYLPQP